MTKVAKVNKTADIIVCSNNGVVPLFSAIENLRWVRQEDGSYIKVSDINLIQNLDRIRSILGEDTYRAIVTEMSKNSVRPSSPIGQLPDNLQIDTMKSRYLQAPVEYRAYVDSITSRFGNLVEQLKDSESEDIESSEVNSAPAAKSE
ncbi:internal scaffolding protein [Dipodfec virus UOA04_Rod_446]|nr:internal scaffolding protein [Dipodfec virus UOA04_Rod_446]